MDDIKAHMHQGSSPRVRGSRIYSRHQADGDGIIPADAGLTHADPTKWAAYRDHPRGCGAHLILRVVIRPQDHPRGCGAHNYVYYSYMDKQGSSPRMRGSLSSASSRYFFPGIIPAGAGLTRGQAPETQLNGDHPRGCGAHILGPSVRWPM